MSIIQLVFDQVSVHLGVLVSAVIDYVEMIEFVDIFPISLHLFINPLGNKSRHNKVQRLKQKVRKDEQLLLICNLGIAVKTCEEGEHNDHWETDSPIGEDFIISIEVRLGRDVSFLA